MTSPQPGPPQLPTPPGWRMEPELAQPQPRRRYAEFNEFRGDPKSVSKFLTGLLGVASSLYVILREPRIEVRQEYLLLLTPFLAFCAWLSIKGARAYFQCIHRNKDFYRYGQPFAGRVSDLAIVPATYRNGSPVTYMHTAQVEGVDPQTKQATSWTFSSRELGILEYMKYAFSFCRGDWVTLLSHPRHGVTLYSLLGVRPDIGLIRKADPGNNERRKRIVVAGLVAIFALLFGPSLFILFTGSSYIPLNLIDYPAMPWMLAGAVLGVLARYAFQRLDRMDREYHRREQDNARSSGRAIPPDLNAYDAPWARALNKESSRLSPVPAPLLVAGEMLLVGMYLNGRLDQSAPVDVPVLVDRMNYTQDDQVIDYRFAPATGETHTLRLPISKAIPVQPGPAVAELRPGRFGMPWVGHLRQEPGEAQP